MTDHKATDGRARARRIRWADRWLLDAFRRARHPLAELAEATAPSAWEALERAGVPADEVLRAACAAAAVEAADLSDVGASNAALLPEDVALRFTVVPVSRSGSLLQVATANPLVEGLEQAIGFAAGCRVRARVASPSAIAAAHRRIYTAPDARGEVAPADRGIRWRRADGRASAVASGNAAALLDTIVAEALVQGASDVHMEPQADDMLVRLRIDGAMHDERRVPHETATNLISRLKVQAGLDISDRMRPQDGRASVTFDGRAVDLRVSTLPLGNRGEKVVVRLLDSATSSVALGALGFNVAERERIERLLTLNEGMFLVTGPTGSGKTTTLYSALRHLQSGRTNIVTVEDPIEYLLEGVNQVQVHDRGGMTFAAALRSILRQDPDVVLVGEIRDADTASTAIKASMTGHLLLSTLHTNDAAGAVARLLDIGADPGALAGALKGVVAQRLVRTLCPACAVDAPLDSIEAEHRALFAGRANVRLRQPVGCSACRGTGYRGRSVVCELLVVTPELQRAIARAASVDEIAEIGRAGGMTSLWESGVARVAEGVTTLDELLDNVATRPVRDEVDVPAQNSTPVALPAPVLAPRPTPIRSIAVPPPARDDAASASRTVVLVVDDARDARAAIAGILAGAGYDVVECADGDAALRYARRLRPAVIVTEVATPRVDATALLRALDDEGARVPVIVWTTQRHAALLAWIEALGAAAVIDKRASAANILDAVAAAAGRVVAAAV